MAFRSTFSRKAASAGLARGSRAIGADEISASGALLPEKLRPPAAARGSPQCCSAKRSRPPGIEIPGYRRSSHPGLPWKPRQGATVGSPGFQSRAAEDADAPGKDGARLSELY